MISIATKLERIDDLVDTSDLSDWETEFVVSVYAQYQKAGKTTKVLSGKQVEIIDRIFNKHFAA